MLGIKWFRSHRESKLAERISRGKRTVAPFHQVLSTLRAEGPRKERQAIMILKEIQEREGALNRLDELRRKLEGAK